MQEISDNLEDYCNPESCQKLPFLFPLEIPSDRFSLDESGDFQYYGRQAFRDLYTAAKSMKFRGTRLYFLHGTFGTGKSYLLAALACLLVKEGRSVVYLPDCRAMLRNPFEYLRAALELTFAGNITARTFLRSATELEELGQFCSAASGEFRLLFIIDQVNALDPQDEAVDRYPSDRKRLVHNLLDSITSLHLKLASSSGNYLHAQHDILRQTGEKRLCLYGGLSKVSPLTKATSRIYQANGLQLEMTKWWWVHQDRLPMDFKEMDKEMIEQLTGRVPIFLSVLLSIKPEDRSGPQDGDDRSPECKDKSPEGGPKAGEDLLGAETTSDDYDNNIARIYDLLWGSAVAKELVASIWQFAQSQSDKLQGTDKLLTYV